MEAVTPLSDSCDKGSRSRKEASLSELLRQRSKADLFQKLCDNGNRSRQEASLAELLRQRSYSVQKRSIISFKTLATTEVGAEKKMKYLSL
jgi:hypothetical protein